MGGGQNCGGVSGDEGDEWGMREVGMECGNVKEIVVQGGGMLDREERGSRKGQQGILEKLEIMVKRDKDWNVGGWIKGQGWDNN